MSGVHPSRALALAVALLGGITRAADQADTTASPAARHPVVAGFARFYADADPNAATEAVEGGLLLLGELNCTSCHSADRAVAARVLRKQAPILDKVGGRVRTSDLRAFLNDPQ